MPNEPNWIITALVGAILGALVVPTVRLLAYPARRIRSHQLGGSWYTYHYSYVNGKPALRYGLLTISTAIASRYAVRLTTSARTIGAEQSPVEPILTYRGRTVPDHVGHLVIMLYGNSHKELLMFRFLSRIPSNAQVVPGVWMAYDHDGHPAAGSEILSRTPLSNTTVQAQLRRWSVLDDRGVLRIRQPPHR